jgi:hypothetical protein
VTISTPQTALLDALRSAQSCRVIAPNDGDYDAARSVMYGGVDGNQNIPPAS